MAKSDIVPLPTGERETMPLWSGGFNKSKREQSPSQRGAVRSRWQPLVWAGGTAFGGLVQTAAEYRTCSCMTLISTFSGRLNKRVRSKLACSSKQQNSGLMMWTTASPIQTGAASQQCYFG